ncbi:AraC family transcriptional regulator [Paraburkholderia sp. BL18I3N2]|nr:AraC family transcriptional regulator [Paraburkholderia sp. BL18I3N2]
MHPYTNRTRAKGAFSGDVAAPSMESEVKIAIVVFAGFSIKEVDALADIFNRAHGNDIVEEKSPSLGLIFKVSLLSIGGGYVDDSLAIRIWTDPVEPRLSEKFDGVFVVGAKCRLGAAEDPDVLRAMSTLVARADVVVWDSDSSLYRFVMASPGTARRGRRLGSARARSRLAPSMTEAGVSFVAALAATSAHARKQIESQILLYLTSSRNAVRKHASPRASTGGHDAQTVDASSMEWTAPIRAAANWLRENYMHPISIAHAAEAANMSERTFLRRFRAEASITPSEYLLEIRLGVVCSLLQQTSLPIDTIARRCGMGSGERLAKIFRRRLSLTPSEFRDANRQGLNPGIHGIDLDK